MLPANRWLFRCIPIFIFGILLFSGITSWNLQGSLVNQELIANSESLNSLSNEIVSSPHFPNPKSAAHYSHQGPIHILGTNWSTTNAIYDFVNGSGTMGNPWTIANVTINAWGAGYGLYIQNSDMDYFKIQNVVIYNTSTSSTGAGIKIENSIMGNIVNATAYNCSNGIYMFSGCNGINITYSHFYNNSVNGIYINAGNYNRIWNNNIHDNGQSGINIYHVMSTFNDVRNNFVANNSKSGAFYYNIWLAYSKNNIVYNNTVLDSKAGGMMMQYSDNNTIDYLTVNDSYIEGLDMNNCFNNTIRNSQFSGNREEGLEIRYSNYTRVYNSIVNNNQGLGFYQSGISYEDARNVTLENITLQGNSRGLCGYTITNFYFKNLTISQTSTFSMLMYTPVNGWVEKSSFTDDMSSLVRLYFADDVIFINNTFQGSDTMNSEGFTLISSTDSTISGNQFYDLYEGLSFSSSNDTTVIYNHVESNTYIGIMIQNFYTSTIQFNDILFNGNYGIYLMDSSDVDILNNTINENTLYGILGQNYDNSTIAGNQFRNNGVANAGWWWGDAACTGNSFDHNDINAAEAIINANSTAIITGQTVAFDGSSSIGDTPLSFVWNFNDTSYAYTEDANHTFWTPATYNVTLEITDNNGEKDTDLIQIYVNADLIPQVSFWDNYTGSIYTEDFVSFQDTTYSGNTPYSYYWLRNASIIYTGANLDYQFNLAGWWNMTLQVEDQDGDINQSYIFIQVIEDSQPDCSFTVNYTLIYVGEYISFNATITGGNLPVSINWSFGDGDYNNSEDPIHKYIIAGIFTARLTVKDWNNDTDTMTMDITVEIDEEVLGNIEIPSGSPYFVNQSIIFHYVGTSGNYPISYQWNFVNGTGSNGTAEFGYHTYNATGNYLITLTVVDRDGDVGIFSINITVVVEDDPPDTEEPPPADQNPVDLSKIMQSPYFKYVIGGLIGGVVVIGLVRTLMSSERKKGPKKQDDNNKGGKGAGVVQTIAQDINWKM